jgi:hypothetical protein
MRLAMWQFDAVLSADRDGKRPWFVMGGFETVNHAVAA